MTSNIFGDILSAAMMLRYTFGLMEEADAIEAAVEKVLNDGCRTHDIAKEGKKRSELRNVEIWLWVRLIK